MISSSSSTRGILQAYQYLNELSDSITKTRGTDHSVLPAAHRHIGYIQGVLMVIFLERKYDDGRLSRVMENLEVGAAQRGWNE